MKRAVSLLLILTLTLLVLCTGCKENENTMLDNEGTITVVDADGISVSIPKNTTKVACWSSTIESTVIGLGACDKLVTSEYFNDSHRWMYDLFPTMKDISKTPTGDWNAEAMLALGVEVVLVKNTKNAETLRNAGLNAVHLDFTTIEATIDSIKIIGQIVGKEEEAQKCADVFAHYDEFVAERLKDLDDSERPVIYYNICRNNTTDPVLTNTYSYGNFDTVWIEKAGGKLASEEMNIGEGLVEINMEELYAADPEIIFTSGVYQEYTYTDLTSGKYYLAGVCNVLFQVKTLWGVSAV